MALATTEEQIAAVEARLSQPGLTDADIDKLERILAILKEEN